MKKPTPVKKPVAIVHDTDTPYVQGSNTYVDFILEGVVEAVSPITVSTADNVPKPGVIFCERVVNGQRVDRACIKGETIKGMVRRRAVELASDILRGRSNRPEDQPFDIVGYYRNAIGGVKGRGKQAPDDINLIIKTAARNPIAYLFGSAEPYWMDGKVNFGFAFGQDDSWGKISGGSRRDDLQNDPALFASFSEEEQKRWFQYADTNKQASKEKQDVKALRREIREIQKKEPLTAASKAEIAEINERIKVANESINQKKDGEVVEETIARPLDAKWAILPGAVLDHGLNGMRLTFGQLGFFLKTLDKVSDDCRIGGNSGTGYGLFKAKWALRLRVTERGLRGDYETVGYVSLAPNELTLPDHPLVTKAMEAFATMRRDPNVDFLYEQRKERAPTEASDAPIDASDEDGLQDDYSKSA